MNYKIENAKINYYYSNNQEPPKQCRGLTHNDIYHLSSQLFIEITSSYRCAIEMSIGKRIEFDVFYIQNNEPATLLKKEKIFNCSKYLTFYVLIKPKPDLQGQLDIKFEERWGPTRLLAQAKLRANQVASDNFSPNSSEKSLPPEVLESFSQAVAKEEKKPPAKKREVKRYSPYPKSSRSKTARKADKVAGQGAMPVLQKTEPQLNSLPKSTIEIVELDP